MTLLLAVTALLEGRTITHEDWPSGTYFRIMPEALTNQDIWAQSKRKGVLSSMLTLLHGVDERRIRILEFEAVRVPAAQTAQPTAEKHKEGGEAVFIRYVVAIEGAAGSVLYWNEQMSDYRPLRFAKLFLSIEEAAEALAKARVQRAGDVYARRLIIPVVV